MPTRQDAITHIPVIEEQAFVTKVEAVTDRVRVSTAVDTRDALVEDVVQIGSLDLERTAVDREVSEAPRPRQDGDVLVISLVEERLVKRLFVVEEIRIRQTTTAETISLPVTLRSTRAIVEHDEHSTTTTGGRL